MVPGSNGDPRTGDPETVYGGFGGLFRDWQGGGGLWGAPWGPAHPKARLFSTLFSSHAHYHQIMIQGMVALGRRIMNPLLVMPSLLVVVLLLVAPSALALPVNTNHLSMELLADPATSPWSVEGVGDRAEVFLFVEFCWDSTPAANPFEVGSRPPQRSLRRRRCWSLCPGAQATSKRVSFPRCTRSVRVAQGGWNWRTSTS